MRESGYYFLQHKRSGKWFICEWNKDWMWWEWDDGLPRTDDEIKDYFIIGDRIKMPDEGDCNNL